MGLNAAGLMVSGNANPNWKGGDVQLNCFVCGKEFSVIPSRKDKAKTCSLKCWNSHQASLKKPPVERRYRKTRDGRKITAQEKIEERSSIKENGCIEWNLKINRSGYASMQHDGKSWLVHRLVWTFKHGEIPEGMCICHKCDNRKCINIDHLFIGTHADNMQDMAQKGRSNSGRYHGEMHGLSKLTESDIHEIRSALSSAKSKDGTSGRLAIQYGVSESTISLIKNNKIWNGWRGKK